MEPEARIALDELVANAALPVEAARAMPKSVYRSDAFARLEVERLFARQWFCVGRIDQFDAPGAYVAVEVAGEPVVVVKGRDGVLRALSNVCLHRMSVIAEGCGRSGRLVCPYHGWSYDLDGRLAAAPAMTRNPAFDKAAMRLAEHRLEVFHGWVMTTLDPDIPSCQELWGDFHAIVADYKMARYKQSFYEVQEWGTNWKILAENFMESYHLPVCHRGTIGGLSDFEDMACPPGGAHFSHHTILKEPDYLLGTAHPDNHDLEGDKRRTTHLAALYPSLLITLTPGYFWYLSLQPLGASRVRLIFAGGMAEEFAGDAEAQRYFAELKQLLDAVNAEDKGCTERVFRGMGSRHAAPGPLSHLERPNADFARWLARSLA